MFPRFIVAAVLLFGLGTSTTTYADCVASEAVFEAVTPQVTRFQDYEVRLFHQTDCQAEPETHIAGIEILKNGRLVYKQTGYSFALGYPLDQDQPPDSVKPAVGMDFTGDGPGVLVSEWSGGAHCCYTFHVFELGTAFKALPAIALLDADESAFVRRPGIKGLVLITADYSAFAYFPKDFAGSPAGRVLLAFQGGKFKLDAPLMKVSAPTNAEIGKCASLFKPSRAWREEANAGQPLGMWYYATDLIYTGNEADAWTFLDKAWGGNLADKRKYLDEYRSRLEKSVYYQDLMQLQKAPLTPAAQKIGWTKHCFDYAHG